MVGGREPIRKEVARMNDIYSTIDKLTADLIEAVYPAEDEGEISPVSLKCEIVKGDVTYYVTTKRDSKGIYEIDIKADTEDEAILKEKRAIIQALDVCLSNPRTIKDIQDGEITVIEAAREVLQVYDVLPQAVEEINEIMSAKKRIVEAVEAAAANTADTKEELEKAKDIDFVPDREINLATARLIREALSDPDTLENIKDGTITTKALINSILSNLEQGITSPVDMAIKTLQMSQKETTNQQNAENKAIEELYKSKNIYSLGKDYEVAIAKFISGYLSRPQTIRDLLDGKETAESSISKAVDIFNNSFNS